MAHHMEVGVACYTPPPAKRVGVVCLTRTSFNENDNIKDGAGLVGVGGACGCGLGGTRGLLRVTGEVPGERVREELRGESLVTSSRKS